MTDISPAQPFAFNSHTNQSTPAQTPTAIQSVEPSESTRMSQNYSGASAQEDSTRFSSGRDDPQVPLDEDTPTGPPPAFEATLLELESHIDIAIKRIEAAREKARNDQAIRADPTATSAPQSDAMLAHDTPEALASPLDRAATDTD